MPLQRISSTSGHSWNHQLFYVSHSMTPCTGKTLFTHLFRLLVKCIFCSKYRDRRLESMQESQSTLSVPQEDFHVTSLKHVMHNQSLCVGYNIQVALLKVTHIFLFLWLFKTTDTFQVFTVNVWGWCWISRSWNQKMIPAIIVICSFATLSPVHSLLLSFRETTALPGRLKKYN